MNGEHVESAIFLANSNNTSLRQIGPVHPNFEARLPESARRVLFEKADVVGFSMDDGYNFRVVTSDQKFRIEEAEFGTRFDGKYLRLAKVVERRVGRDGLIIIVS